MPSPPVSERDFIRLFQEFGGAELARRLPSTIRAVMKRRAAIEARRGITLESPNKWGYNLRNNRDARPIHKGRIVTEIQDGVVLVGSDAHYWPGPPSLMHRAFVAFAKEYKPKIVVMNGDVVDAATISRHPPIGWENRPTVQEEIEAVQERLGEIEKAASKTTKVWTLGNHDCLTTGCRCLTKRGWVEWDDIKETDQVLSKIGNTCVWSPIDGIVSFPFDGELVSIESRDINIDVTPNHRILLKNHKGNEEYRTANRLESRFYLPVSAISRHTGVQLSDEELRLAGWILTDGGYSQGINIYQSKKDGIREIHRVLTALGISFTYRERNRDIKAIAGRELLKPPLPQGQFYIHAVSRARVKNIVPERGRLPDWAHDLSPRQFSVLLEALIAGDGGWDGCHPEEKTCAALYKDKAFLESVQAVAVQHGWRARVMQDKRGHSVLRLNASCDLTIDKKKYVFTKKYTGIVWCLRVPHGNFMVSQNGSAHFTGNSRYETRLASVAPEYAKIHGMHLADHFPLWEKAWSVFVNDHPGGVVIKHRFKGGMHAPQNNALWAGRSIVTGHLHSAKVYPISDYSDDPKYGVDTGCLADPWHEAFVDYTEDSPKNWRAGFGLLTFKNGRLLYPELVQKWDENSVQFRGEIIKI